MAAPVIVEPRDAHNRALVDNVHPGDWQNPTPEGRYNLVVIGAGSGGLITSLVASSLGARVALVERHLLGGDCLNVGCVPSKAVIRAAHVVHDARTLAPEFGLRVSGEPDFAAAWERMRRVRARISSEDAAARYRDEFGVDVYLGEARFVADGVIDVDGCELEYARAVIATGARAAAPPVPGLAEVGHLDNESVFELTSPPRRLGVIGAGPIGVELAQTFQRLGTDVTLFERADQILTREDPDAAAVVQRALERDGVTLDLGCRLERIEKRGDDKVVVLACPERGDRQVAVDELLVGAGRAPNVEGLGLETVGVEYDPRTGVRVDDGLRTTNPAVFAVGDVCMQWKFTHAADAAAKLVVQNALFFGRKKLSDLVMPWCTYTDPEIAHVGMYEHDAREAGIGIDTYQAPLTSANRAVTDGHEEGFVKIHCREGKDEIVGGTIVAPNAGDLVTQLTLAIRHGIGLGGFTDVVYPYPTLGEAIKRASGEYTRTRLTPTVAKAFETLMRWRR